MSHVGLRCALACAWLFVATHVGVGATLYVDPVNGSDGYTGLCQTFDGDECGPKLTIKAAMDAAVDGDEVVLLEGTYKGDGNRDLDFAGKAITVRSANPDDADVVAATVIDCEATKDNRRRAFKLANSEATDSQILGLTIRNGVAPVDIAFGSVNFPAGGAIACDAGSATIAQCVFTQCSAMEGAAVFCRDATLIVNACRFEDNATARYTKGSNYYEGSGAGIDTLNASLRVTNSLFRRCTANLGGGAVSVFEGSADIVACEFEENSAQSTSFTAVGGAIWSDLHTSLTVDRCAFLKNACPTGRGGAIAARGTQSALTNCLFVENRARSGDGAIRFGGTDMGSVVGCTITGSSSPAVVRTVGKLTITSSILWSNDTPVLRQDSSTTVTYSDVQGGWSGTGNINADPLFNDAAGGDFRLDSSSPCIDAGDPNESAPGVDLDGLRRIWNGRVDVGAYEFGSFAYGDMNCDAAITFDDIDPFVVALTGEDAYNDSQPECEWLNADVDGDGAVTFSDIDPFVSRLIQN